MMMPQTITDTVRAAAADLGFSRFGVIPAGPARRLDAYLRWVEAGMFGEMTYLAREDRVLRRRDPSVILPGVQSIICVGLDYFSAELPPAIAADPSRGRVSNYAWGIDYHDVMTPRLEELGRLLAAAAAPSGDRVAGRVYVDTGAILERDHAESAGLGFTGKNTMLIDPRRGSWFFLGELLTTLPLVPTNVDADAPARRLPSCGNCRRCLAACPTGAFPEPYVLDARRCISYLTIELKGWIPSELRPLMGNWVYGCDICQEVCPFNRFTRPTGELAFRAANWDAAAPRLLELLALDEAGFTERFAHSPIRRIRRARLLRNACVAAGNWGSEEALGPLKALLMDPEPLLRGHAAWAIGRIGERGGLAAVAAALAQESDADVRGEMAAVL